MRQHVVERCACWFSLLGVFAATTVETATGKPILPLRRMPRANSAAGATCVILAGEFRNGPVQPGPHKMVEVASARLAAGAPRLPAHAVGSGAFHSPRQPRGPRLLELALGLAEIFVVRAPPLDSPPMTQTSPAGALTVRGSERRNYEW